MRGQRERKKHWASFCTLGTISPKIRKKCPHHQNSRSLSCSHCPCNPCHCWLAWGVDWEWMERGFKIQECLYSFWPLGVFSLASLTKRRLFLEFFLVCTQWVFPHFELPLNPSWVIPDGRDKQIRQETHCWFCTALNSGLLPWFICYQLLFRVPRELLHEVFAGCSCIQWERLGVYSVLPSSGIPSHWKRSKMYCYISVLVSIKRQVALFSSYFHCDISYPNTHVPGQRMT